MNITSLYSGILISYENFQKTIIFENCSFTNITSKQDMFEISQSYLYITNSTFDIIYNLNILSDFSSIYINGDIFRNITCKNLDNGCIFSCISNSVIEINNTYMTGIDNTDLPGNMYLQNSIARINNLIIDDMKANRYRGACIYSLQSNLYINNSKFSNYDYNCLYMIETDTNLTYILFNNEEKHKEESLVQGDKGTIYCDSCSNFDVQNSIFMENWNSGLGGGIAITNSLKITVNVIYIYNCLFECNMVYDSGGAIYLSNVQGHVIANNFTLNMAVNGGAMYYFTGSISKYIYIYIYNFN